MAAFGPLRQSAERPSLGRIADRSVQPEVARQLMGRLLTRRFWKQYWREHTPEVSMQPGIGEYVAPELIP
jgi:hypothetical protein